MYSHAATGATMTAAANVTSIAPGGTLSVVLTEDSGTDPVNSVQASLNYDATQLQYVSMSEGTAFPTVAATSTSTPGVIRVGRATSTPVSGSNTIVTLQFKVLASTGTISLTLDKSYSFVVRSTDNTDILSVVTGSSVAVSGGSNASASMYLSPGTGTAAPGSTISVALRENSGSNSVNSVQASVGYDATQLQYVGLTEGSTFPVAAATDTGTAGRVRVARATPAGSLGVSGDNLIVTLSFKVLASSGTAALTLDKTQSFVVSSSTNTDILATVAGASFTVSSTSSGGAATLSLSPNSGSFAQGSTISVQVKATSSTAALTTVEVGLSYPASQLQYLSTTEGGVFTTVQRTNTATAGTIDIIRSLPGGSAGVTGTNPVVTIYFKVLGSSGSAALSYTSASAIYDDSGTGTNILNMSGSTAATYTLTAVVATPPPPPPPPAGTATMSLSPASGSFAPNSPIAVQVKVSSSTAALTTVEANLNYPDSQLQYVSTTEGTVFTTVQRTNTATAGTIDIIRSLPGGSAGVTGTNTVVTINFKVIGSSGSAALAYGSLSAIYDDSGTGTNIMDKANSSGASYTIAATPTCSSSPSTPGMPSKTGSTYTTINLAWTASTAGSNCTLAGYHVYRDGTIVSDVMSGASFTDSGLMSGTSYSYQIGAFDTAGHTSALSPAASLTTQIDNMAPTMPVGVTAAAPDSASVNLAWSPSTDYPNPGGVGVAGYRIYRNGATTPTYTVTSGTSFTDTNVSPSTTYSYTVTAYDKLGNESAPSNIVSAKTAPATVSCTGSPSTPTGLTAAGVTMTTISLTWSGSTAASNCTLAGYHVYRDAALLGSAGAASFSDSGLTPSTSYTYTVVAYDTNGHVSAASSAITVTTAADTQAPTAPASVTATAFSAGQVDLAWSASTDNVGVTAYKIYRGGNLIKTVNGAALSYSDTTVSANTDYTYAVAAMDAAGNTSIKTTAVPNPVHTPAAADTQAPTVPTGLHLLLVDTSSAAIAWTASTDNVGVAGYHVYRGGTYINDASGPSFADTGLASGTTYSYTVKAFDASGNTSAASAAFSVTTLQPAGCIVGDLNCDGVVNLLDLSIMLTHWQEVNVPVKYGDINQDGKVDIFDLSTLISHLGDKA